MIAARSVSKRFGRISALDDLTLDVTGARITAIVGPNSAGKTTFAKCILGLTRPDSGSIQFNGAPIGDDASYRSHIGYMPQIARFPENLTAAELFAMLRDVRPPGTPLDEDLISGLGLSGELGKPFRTLSGGTRQKVNAVMAFLFKPDLFILDEPTAGLDPIASGVLKDKIRSERSVGKTFILTSHIMSELEELAEDVAFIHEGRVGFAGPVKELIRTTRENTLERAIAQMMKHGVAA
ncbi:MAG TPA: ABC transporter ATP-binding protein [Gemmatimonadaceae bacterium]|nr:ABC transporter ATP-binding protein [Gemmatimonadaceae bacterium]